MVIIDILPDMILSYFFTNRPYGAFEKAATIATRCRILRQLFPTFQIKFLVKF